MTDPSDFARAYARDVRVDPTVNGADNVQDALAAGGGAPSGTFVQATTATSASPDALTTVPFDGAGHAATCLTATPPAWLDNAGNIIATGLYVVQCQVIQNTPPTVPGLFCYTSNVNGSEVDPVDGIVAFGTIVHDAIVSVATGDLPFSTLCTFTAQTDVTGVFSAQVLVRRLSTALP